MEYALKNNFLSNSIPFSQQCYGAESSLRVAMAAERDFEFRILLLLPPRRYINMPCLGGAEDCMFKALMSS